MARTFSLCLTTQKLADKDKIVLFRIADKTGDELQQYNFYEQDASEGYDDNGSKYPHTIPPNYNIGELKIWEWDPQVKEWAKKTAIPFYELIDTIDATPISKETLLIMLKKGQVLPQYHGQRSLLVIDEDEDDYTVVEIDSSVVKSISGLVKLNDGVNKINGYYLNKRDFFSTEKITVISKDGEKLPPRKVYKYLSMQEPDFQIETKSFYEKLELFIGKQIKTRNLSKAQQREIKNLFIEILSDYDTISKFFEENGFNKEKLNEKIHNLSKCITEVFDENNSWDEFCRVMIENIPELTNRFMATVEKKFYEDNKDKVISAESEVVQAEQQKVRLLGECQKYQSDIGKLEEKKSTIEKDIAEMHEVCDRLRDSMKDKIADIKQDFCNFISDRVIFDMFGKSTTVGQQCITRLSHTVDDDIDFLYNINEFVDSLKINLQIAGVEKANTDAVSKFITATILQKTSLLMAGKFASNIADAISATFCGMTADIISIISPDITLGEIMEKINSSKSKVILITNIVNLNETIALQLCKINVNKIIILANDITETVNFIPNSILNWFNLLCLDYICERKVEEDYVFSDASKVNFNVTANSSTYKAAKEELRLLVDTCVFSSSHCANKAELIALIDSFEGKDGMLTWLFCEAIPHKILTTNIDSVDDIIEKCSLSEKSIEKIKRIFR